MEKRPDEALNPEQAARNEDTGAPVSSQLLLEQVFRLVGYAHPVSRRRLVVEARRLWDKLGILGPIPAVVERRPSGCSSSHRTVVYCEVSNRRLGGGL